MPNLLAASSTASHFPTCMCRGGTWFRFKWAITRTEDEHATIVPANQLRCQLFFCARVFMCCRSVHTCVYLCVVDLCVGSQAFGGVYQVEVEEGGVAPQVVMYDSACYTCSMTENPTATCALKAVRSDSHQAKAIAFYCHIAKLRYSRTIG